MWASVELCRVRETDLLSEPDRVLVRREIHHRAMAWSGEERKSDNRTDQRVQISAMGGSR